MRRIAVLGAVVGVALGLPTLAAAASVVQVTPAAIKPGHKVRLHGPIACNPGDEVEIVSFAFKGAGHKEKGVPDVLTTVRPDGTYSVRFRIRKSVHRARYGITLLCDHGFFGTGSLKVT